MNLLYKNLITVFLEKANIKQDAAQIANILKQAYPECKLPVEKTISRFLSGETTHPQGSFLGFLAAYVLDKSEAEVSQAYQDGSLKEFYKTFVNQYEKTGENTITPPPSVQEEDKVPKTQRFNKERIKPIFLWILVIILLLIIVDTYYLRKSPELPTVPPPQMVPIKGGVFTIGDTFNDTDTTVNEKNRHDVFIDDFEMSNTEITFELFDAYCRAKNIMLKENLDKGRAQQPAIMMDWYEAIDFCNWLSEKQGLEVIYTIENNQSSLTRKVRSNFKNNGYRLPTEAEWEYAAKVDLKSDTMRKIYRFGNHKNIADGNVLNFNFQKEAKTDYMIPGRIFHGKTVNVFESGMNNNGLYGMAGNVSEWCHDFYHPNFYSDIKNINNPIAEETFYKDTSSTHILRGGNWEAPLMKIRATYRESSSANCRSKVFGFRVVRRVLK